MAQSQKNDARHRLAMPAAMLAILLASVAVAALLVHRRSGPIDRGREILRTIRARGLPPYWSADRQVLWYLRLDPRGRPHGWWVASRDAADGGYAGRKILFGQEVYVERWQLNDAATAGRYWASPATGAGISTRIDLDRGAVTVSQTDGARLASAADPAPDNYIPEGLDTLAFRLAAAGGEKAIFRMVFNEQAVVGGRVYFATALVQPLSPRRVRVTYEMYGGDMSKTIEFDADGRIDSGEDLDSHHTFRRVSLEELVKAYPEAKRYADRLFDSEKSEGDEDL